MDRAELIAYGWKFRLINRELTIESEQDPSLHVEISAQAAFSLLNYLYQYRADVASAAESIAADQERGLNSTKGGHK
jgi:hypothetical protein